MKMTKEEARRCINHLSVKIDELKAYVKNMKDEHMVTLDNTLYDEQTAMNIGYHEVGRVLHTEEWGGDGRPGNVKAGHHASLILYGFDGTWYNGNGEKQAGYMYFKPNGE